MFGVVALHSVNGAVPRDPALDPRDLVFVSLNATPLDGIVVTRRFQTLQPAAVLPHQRFHDLRRVCARFLSQGIAARVVMEKLGHSQIKLTLNTYTHVSPALGRVAAERTNDLLGPQDADGLTAGAG